MRDRTLSRLLSGSEADVVLPTPLRPMMVRRSVAHHFAVLHLEGDVFQRPDDFLLGRATDLAGEVVEGGGCQVGEALAQGGELLLAGSDAVLL